MFLMQYRLLKADDVLNPDLASLLPVLRVSVSNLWLPLLAG